MADGVAIGLLLLAFSIASFILLLWNALELAPSQPEERKPALRRRILAASAVPIVLVAAGFVFLAAAQ